YPNSDIVFYNFGDCGGDTECTDHVRQVDRDNASEMHRRGFVTRLYSNDSPLNWDLARRTTAADPIAPAANFIATHHGADTTTFRLSNVPTRGYPFVCIDALDNHCDTSSWIEDGAPAIRLVATSAGATFDANYYGQARSDSLGTQPGTRT